VVEATCASGKAARDTHAARRVSLGAATPGQCVADISAAASCLPPWNSWTAACVNAVEGIARLLPKVMTAGLIIDADGFAADVDDAIARNRRYRAQPRCRVREATEGRSGRGYGRAARLRFPAIGPACARNAVHDGTTRATFFFQPPNVTRAYGELSVKHGLGLQCFHGR